MATEINTSALRSRRRRILAYLQQGNTITPMEAVQIFGETKLATRISELINYDGHTEICKRWVTVHTKDAGCIVETRVKEYFIDPVLL